MSRVSLACFVACLAAAPAQSARLTQIAFTQPELELQYSQGAAVEVHVTYSADGALVPGSACTDPPNDNTPCNVRYQIARTDTPDERAPLGPIPNDQLVVDEEGSSSKRVVVVEGVHGPDVVWQASDDGVSYTITATFLGDGNPDPADCQEDSADVEDGDECPATATMILLVTQEIAQVQIQPGSEGDIGDTIQLAAHVDDPNGDAELGSSDLDGPGVKNLAGLTISFYYDVSQDRRPDANEKIAEAITNSEGNAGVEFLLSPEFVSAGDYEQGLFAEMASDGRYGVSRASSRIIIHGGAVDPSRTILEADPKEVPADNVTTITLTARLVDENNDLLDENAAEHVVVFTSELGKLEDDVKRDLNTGLYSQKLRATRKAGESKITVSVDGQPGAEATILFTGENCTCGGATLAPLLPCLAGLAFLRRRKR